MSGVQLQCNINEIVQYIYLSLTNKVWVHPNKRIKFLNLRLELFIYYWTHIQNIGVVQKKICTLCPT